MKHGRLAASVLALLVLTARCMHEKPELRFYPKFAAVMPLSTIWARAGTSLVHDSMDYNYGDMPTFAPGGDEDMPGYVSKSDPDVQPNDRHTGTSHMRYDFFTAIVRGRLSRGLINIRASYVAEDGSRETAFVKPKSIGADNRYETENSLDIVQHQGNFEAFKMWQLNPVGDGVLPRVYPGRYHVSLVRNGKELCSSDLTISK
jgi:hypothetical protein